jgi:hypothetical protein
MPKTGIDEETRKQVLGDMFWAIVSQTPFDPQGFGTIADVARFIYLDTAAIPYNEDTWMTIADEDGHRNYTDRFKYIRKVQYLKKHHPEVYNNLKPWLGGD